MKVKEFLNARRVSYTVYEHPETYDARRLAESLRVPGHNVAKTVLVRTEGPGKYVVLVLPATAMVDLQRVSQALDGASVHLAGEFEIAEHSPGCDFGILPPFGSLLGMETIADESLARHYDIFFQGDTHREAIRMKYSDFYQLEHPRVVSMTNGHQTKPST